MDSLQYTVLTPNLWQQHFTMFELQEIMRQKESKELAEILNRLIEGRHTHVDILKIKERLISDELQITDSYPIDVTHLFIQNHAKVNEYNNRVHHALPGTKCEITAQDSVIGANSAELRDKTMKQILTDPRETKQLVFNFQLAEGERTELAINVRIDDGLTNGASDVIRKIQLNDKNKPSGIVWVKFDHEDVGQKTRYENRRLYRGYSFIMDTN